MSLLDSFRRQKPKATTSVGSHGTQIIGGYIVENEKTGELSNAAKFRTYSEMLANVSIVAASVRYFLGLAGKSTWTFTPSDADKDGYYAGLAEEMLTSDPRTPWSRIVRRSCMYRFYGFSLQEWTARRRDDGVITFADIAPRPQRTIERWDVEDDGTVRGVTQLNPNNAQEIYLPRQKLLYVVDDSLNDSPTGLGIFRHLAEPTKRLLRLQQLELIGYENDLRGTPIARAPYSELQKMVEDGELTKEQMEAVLAPIHKFLKKHVNSPARGISLDSSVYSTNDEKESPSAARKFDLEVVQGGPTSLEHVQDAIVRINKELARILGTEGMILGDSGSGSLALSRDKSQQLSLSVDSTLADVAWAMEDDLLWTLWQLNGFPPEMMPSMSHSATAFVDAEQITAALRDMAQAGATLHPNDPAVNEVRGLLGVSPVDAGLLELENILLGNDVLTEDPEGKTEDPEEVPEDETQEGPE